MTKLTLVTCTCAHIHVCTCPIKSLHVLTEQERAAVLVKR